MKHENPCFDCPDSGHGNGSGCGKHATCEKYKRYYSNQREKEQKNKRAAIVNSYTKDAIERVKNANTCSLQKYRKKEK